jgi:rhodanese-related sulfurtransferase
MITPLPELVADAKAQCHCISFEQVPSFIQNHTSLIFIDVREPEEHQQSAVKGSINIPRGVLEMKLPSITNDADQPILLHCATGGRAALSALALKKMGYKNVTVIDGSHEQLCSIC